MDRRDSSALSDTQILDLARLIAHVERLYEKPIDIEWAYAKGRLFLLQARDRSPHMSPCRPRWSRLYLDIPISVQGMYHPISLLLKKAGVMLLAGDRLQSSGQAFELTLDQLDRAFRAPTLDLLKQAKENKAFVDRLARVPQLPTVVDSRGLILRPPPAPMREGEVAGTPVSSGIARGRVKILHSPDEKPLAKGEILVARATDPGWTPLFVNASGVILEVGGLLQHGALVAREYRLPCVAGVEMPPNCGTMAISSKWMALRESCGSSLSPNLPQLCARGADDGGVLTPFLLGSPPKNCLPPVGCFIREQRRAPGPPRGEAGSKKLR
jgi:phosphohistidine swiveling domain-containing protein